MIAFVDGYQASPEAARGDVPKALFVTNDRKWSGGYGASVPEDSAGFVVTSLTKLPENLHIVDVAPTALALLGVDKPDGTDGEAWAPIGAPREPTIAALRGPTPSKDDDGQPQGADGDGAPGDAAAESPAAGQQEASP